MFATDFLFNEQMSSDLGLMICSFNGELETASGDEIEYTVEETPNRDKFPFYSETKLLLEMRIQILTYRPF